MGKPYSTTETGAGDNGTPATGMSQDLKEKPERTQGIPLKGETSFTGKGASEFLAFLQTSDVRWWNRKWWGAQTPEYRSWLSMWRRVVEDPNYVEQGVGVCGRWTDYAVFLEDVVERPEPKERYSLGRIDNDENYEPGNVRWETRQQQAVNKRTNRYVEIGGERMVAKEAARRFGVSIATVRKRLDRGLTGADVVRRVTTVANVHAKRVEQENRRVLLIRVLFQAGWANAAIVRAVGGSRREVGELCCDPVWWHISPTGKEDALKLLKQYRGEA